MDTSPHKTASTEPPTPKAKPHLSRQQALEAYEHMLLIRRFEEKAGQLYGMGLVGGFCHLYIGQEAVAIGIRLAAEEGDQMITGYRDHGHMLACGMEPKHVMAELTGRRDGYSRGKGGSMHMFSVKKHFYGGHGIVGAQVPLGAGLGFANQYRNNGYVSIVFFGDGAANQGQVYEVFNMAKLWSLPIVFVIENNQYGMGTHVDRASATTNLSQRGVSFAIPGVQVNGMDVEAVYNSAATALAYARSGKGPYILEMLTYRYRGHSMSDPAKYRSKDEVQEKKMQDPIEHQKSLLLKKGWADEEQLKRLDKTVKTRVAEAVEFAQNNPEPDPAELWTDIVVGT